jgi:hypothetical protein
MIEEISSIIGRISYRFKNMWNVTKKDRLLLLSIFVAPTCAAVLIELAGFMIVLIMILAIIYYVSTLEENEND